MTTETLRGQRGETFHLRTQAERNRAFVKAARHSRAVRILRIALPVVAVSVLAAYFISSSMKVTVGDVEASISGIEVTDGALRMTNPTLKGVDEENGDYVISAAYADQEVANPNLIKLHEIKADVNNGDEGWSRMSALRGTFDSENEKLVMNEKIRVQTSSGITGQLSLAEIDMAKQVLHSPNPVVFQMDGSTIRSKTLTFHSAKKELEFAGEVRVHLVPKANKAKEAVSGQGSGAAPASAPMPTRKTLP
ncbi:LPS export ABC transporter periplasmic protein LptC [Methyloligella solikamskensis]|uniref:LPS export ABC transporter periplasmic protein LptC n=1 Tax=Methyloligella solikamskensis TaxID=1177756 RepID=A0ABW3J7N3_9HYPH